MIGASTDQEPAPYIVDPISVRNATRNSKAGRPLQHAQAKICNSLRYL